MFCKFCGTEMDDTAQVCPECGKAAGNDKLWKILLISLGALLLTAVLVVAVLYGTGVLGKEEKKETVTQPVAEKIGYTVDDETAKKQADVVVATVGDAKLTNGELQLHYWYQVYNFLNQNYYYLSMIGMDLSVGLNEQKCTMDETKTWEEYFLDQALESWKSYAVLCQLAKQEAFQLNEEAQKSLEEIRTTVETEAKNYGYATVDEMLLAEAGAGCTLDGFVAYRELMLMSMEFFTQKYEGMTPTEDEVIAYFDEKAATYEEAGITKDGGSYGTVRHILIKAEGTTDENGATVYSEEQWAACLAEAERVYQLWKDGDATEDSFVAMVAEHTDDPGSAATGGLYEKIGPNSGYVPEFEAWAIDAARQVGDTALVKVEASNYAGYHFMYYVGGEPIWKATAEADLLNERFTAYMEEGNEAYPMTVEYDKIVLGKVALA